MVHRQTKHIVLLASVLHIDPAFAAPPWDPPGWAFLAHGLHRNMQRCFSPVAATPSHVGTWGSWFESGEDSSRVFRTFWAVLNKAGRAKGLGSGGEGEWFSLNPVSYPFTVQPG